MGEENAGLYASRAFVCVSCMRLFLSFSLPLGVGGWLRIVTVALPGLFYFYNFGHYIYFRITSAKPN